MAHAPVKVAKSILVCRLMAVGVEAAAVTYCIKAQDFAFSTLRFLKMVLLVHLPLSALRLLYDFAQVFLQEPLPADGRLMATLVVSEWITLVFLFAAGTSSASVVEYLYNGLKKCSVLPPHFCARYEAAVLLTLAACAINAAIGFLMFYLGVFWDLAAQDAAAAEAAAVAEAAAA